MAQNGNSPPPEKRLPTQVHGHRRFRRPCLPPMDIFVARGSIVEDEEAMASEKFKLVSNQLLSVLIQKDYAKINPLIQNFKF